MHKGLETLSKVLITVWKTWLAWERKAKKKNHLWKGCVPLLPVLPEHQLLWCPHSVPHATGDLCQLHRISEMLWLRAASGEQGSAPRDLERSPAAFQGQRPHLMCPGLPLGIRGIRGWQDLVFQMGKMALLGFLNLAQEGHGLAVLTCKPSRNGRTPAQLMVMVKLKVPQSMTI